MKKLAILALTGLPFAASAQLFSDNFDLDHSAAWKFNSSIGATDLAADNTGGEANFFFDYSTVGIPSAPHSGGTTRGLKLEANIIGTGVFSGVSASPIGKSFVGDYTLSFDAWQNVLGPFPAGGSGSTQLLTSGIGALEGTAQFQGTAVNGVMFGATGDGGSGNDYRAYTATGAVLSDTSGTYAAGNTAGASNNSNAYYTSKFQGSVPAAQLSLFPGQTGTPAAGALGMAWHSWEIKKTGSVVTWSVDGYLIATATKATFDGSDLFVGLADINTGSSASADSRALSFGLIDNVKVEAVPEPGTMAILGLGTLAMLRRRRRA